MRKLSAVAAIMMIACLVAPQAHAAVNAGVAGPAAALVGFATPQIVVVKSEPVTFVNLDPIAIHDLVSVKVNALHQPIFSTPTISAGQTATVNGIGALAPGVYAFVCTIHSGIMKGTLTIEA